jgi:hypothetical protein
MPFDKASLSFSEAGMNRVRSAKDVLMLAVVAQAAVLLAGCGEKPAEHSVALGQDAERWYGVYMQGVKVGHSVTRTRILEENGEKLVETVTSGLIETQKGEAVVRMQLSSTSVETPDGGLRRFSRTNESGAEPEVARGSVHDGQLTIHDTTGANRSLAWLPATRGFHAWEKILAASPPPAGEVRRFDALDESFLTIVPQELVGGKLEETSTPAGTKTLRRMEHRVEMPGGQRRATQLWIDEHGLCVKLRDDTMDMEFHRMSRETALAPADKKLNLLYDTMVRLDPPLANARRTRWVRYRVTLERGETEKLFATGPMQDVRGIDSHAVELVVRAVSPTTNLADNTGGQTFTAEGPAPDETYLKPNHYIAAGDPRVVAMARSVASVERDPWLLAIALERHVHTAIKQFDYGQAFLTAAEVLEAGKGDCSEYAVLLAALLRERQIPSRVAIGLVYVENAVAMGYHMWTEAWINGRWVGLDATQGAGGIAADHIKVAATNLEGGLADPALLSLGQLLGAKPKIEVIESQYRE